MGPDPRAAQLIKFLLPLLERPYVIASPLTLRSHPYYIFFKPDGLHLGNVHGRRFGTPVPVFTVPRSVTAPGRLDRALFSGFAPVPLLG
jgi:hypothetical protein